MARKFTVHADSGLVEQIDGNPSFNKERRIVAIAKWNKLIGKIVFALHFPQAIRWVAEKRLAMKMSTMYMAAMDYFANSGISKELLDVVAELFGVIGEKPVSKGLKKIVRYICASWHDKVRRMILLLTDEFRCGKNVESVGCGSGFIEILALVASGNKQAKLILTDIDPANIELATEVIALFEKRGYNIANQVSVVVADVRKRAVPECIDTIVSIGLLYNYFGLDEAGSIVRSWFNAGVTKVISDYIYDMENMTEYEAPLRIAAIRNITGWKIGPGGLLFYSVADIQNSLSDYDLELYDHALSSTFVITNG